jgi:hypothetical protein
LITPHSQKLTAGTSSRHPIFCVHVPRLARSSPPAVSRRTLVDSPARDLSKFLLVPTTDSELLEQTWSSIGVALLKCSREVQRAMAEVCASMLRRSEDVLKGLVVVSKSGEQPQSRLVSLSKTRTERAADVRKDSATYLLSIRISGNQFFLILKLCGRAVLNRIMACTAVDASHHEREVVARCLQVEEFSMDVHGGHERSMRSQASSCFRTDDVILQLIDYRDTTRCS